MAPNRGIVIQIQGDGSSARQALEMVRDQMRQTETAADSSSGAYMRFGSSVEHGVPQMAAASAALRALRGDFTENMRAGERFLGMLPGMESMLQTAFPTVGAISLGYALFELADKTYNAFVNIVELKGALQELGQVDITVGKKLSSNADEIERSVEQILEAKGGNAAALKQKLSYEGSKPIDLSDLFYDKSFSGLKDNIKANYEDLYKSVAPADAPEKIRQIRTEVQNLTQALQAVEAGDMGGFVPKVDGFGPTMLEDPEKYYKARIRAATDVEQLLSSEYDKRAALMQAIQTESQKPVKVPGVHSDGRFGEQAAQLAEEQGKAAASAQRTIDEQDLAELDAQHKMLLISDSDYYAEKLARQMGEIDAEESALRRHQQVLQGLYEKQRGDKTLKRGQDGQSAEEIRTQQQMIANQEQLNALEAKRAHVSSDNAAEVNLANQTAQMNNLRALAELEKQRGDGIAAQIGLLEAETALEVKKAAAAGESQQAQDAIRANGQLLEQKLRIADVDRQIQQTEQTFNTAAREIEDRASKGAITKLEAERQLNALHRQEVAVLQSLVQQYDALAQTLGGPFVQKANDLHAALSELQTPDKSKEPQFGKTLQSGITKMADTLVSQSIRGKEAFHQMAKQMEVEAAELALKLTMLKLFGDQSNGGSGGSGGGGGSGWLGDLGGIFSSMFKNLPQFAEGGSPDGPSIVGEKGIELWTPPAKGGTITPNAMLQKIASGGGGGRAPSVTNNVINQSSQPVTVQSSETSYSNQMHEFTTNVVLKDLSSNGPIRQALSGFGG